VTMPSVTRVRYRPETRTRVSTVAPGSVRSSWRSRGRSSHRSAARDPEAALRWLLRPRLRRLLRTLPGATVETRVRVSGRYRTLVTDGMVTEQLVSPNGKRFYDLRLAGSPRFTADELISVRGIRIGRDILVPRGAVGRVRGTDRRLFSDTTGVVQTAVITVSFTDNAKPIDMSAIEGVFQGNPGHDVDSYFSETSYGQMTLAPSFYGPYTLNESASAGCYSNTWMQDAMNAANADVDFTQFRRLVFVLNCANISGFGYSEGPVSTPDGTITAGLALLGAPAVNVQEVTHEISHTLGAGLKHAGFLVCLPAQFSPPTRFGPNCDSAEYGDPFEVLGDTWRRASQLDPSHKAAAGWLTPANFPTVTTSGTYTLSPYELPSSGPLALNIPRGGSGTAFTVEYRQPIGFDSWMGSPTLCPGCTATQGASIRLAGTVFPGNGGGSDTELIDTTPGSIP